MSELLGLTERTLLYHAAVCWLLFSSDSAWGNPTCAWIGQV